MDLALAAWLSFKVGLSFADAITTGEHPAISSMAATLSETFTVNQSGRFTASQPRLACLLAEQLQTCRAVDVVVCRLEILAESCSPAT